MKSIVLKRWLLSLVVMLFLTGCGQKGPLFLPEDEEQTDDQQTNVEPTIHSV